MTSAAEVKIDQFYDVLGHRSMLARARDPFLKPQRSNPRDGLQDAWARVVELFRAKVDRIIGRLDGVSKQQIFDIKWNPDVEHEVAAANWEVALGRLLSIQTQFQSDGERQFRRDVATVSPALLRDYKRAREAAMDNIGEAIEFIENFILGNGPSFVPDVESAPGPTVDLEL